MENDLYATAKTFTEVSEFVTYCNGMGYTETQIQEGLEYFDHKLYDQDKEIWKLQNEVTKLTMAIKGTIKTIDECVELIDSGEATFDYNQILRNAEKLQGAQSISELPKNQFTRESYEENLPY